MVIGISTLLLSLPAQLLLPYPPHYKGQFANKEMILKACFRLKMRDRNPFEVGASGEMYLKGRGREIQTKAFQSHKYQCSKEECINGNLIRKEVTKHK